MREIKFRGYGKDEKGKHWIYGNLLDEKLIGLVAIQDEKCHVWEVDSESVGQYTGLKDADGREIYEGDVIDIDGDFIAEVVYCDGAYELYAKQGPLGKLGDIAYEYSLAIVDGVIETFSVIGNIHDNPDLLEK